MNIESYLNTEQFKTRQELVKETNMKDRAVRNQISNLKKIRPVIYNSQTRGYRLEKDIKSFNKEDETKKEKEKIKNYKNK